MASYSKQTNMVWLQNTFFEFNEREQKLKLMVSKDFFQWSKAFECKTEPTVQSQFKLRNKVLPRSAGAGAFKDVFVLACDCFRIGLQTVDLTSSFKPCCLDLMQLTYFKQA